MVGVEFLAEVEGSWSPVGSSQLQPGPPQKTTFHRRPAPVNSGQDLHRRPLSVNYSQDLQMGPSSGNSSKDLHIHNRPPKVISWAGVDRSWSFLEDLAGAEGRWAAWSSWLKLTGAGRLSAQPGPPQKTTFHQPQPRSRQPTTFHQLQP